MAMQQLNVRLMGEIRQSKAPPRPTVSPDPETSAAAASSRPCDKNHHCLTAEDAPKLLAAHDELLETERNYVAKLGVLVHDFMARVASMLEADQSFAIFSNCQVRPATAPAAARRIPPPPASPARRVDHR